jgi:hypothetical protein
LVTATLLIRRIGHGPNAAVFAPHLETYGGMRIQKTVAALCSIFVAQCLIVSAFALKVTEPAAASHGYPGLCDMNGKKLADGEFRQWVENNRLHVVITYKFSAG